MVAAPEVVVASAPQVEFAACEGRSADGTTCTLESADSEVLLWIPAPVVPVIEIDGAPAQAHLRPSRGEAGWTAAVFVPVHAQELSVRDGLAAAGSAQPWKLRLERHPPMPTLAAIKAKLPDQNSQGRTDPARGVLAELDAAIPRLHGHERHEALHLATLLALDVGDTVGGTRRGRQALEDALASGQLHDAIEIGLVLVHNFDQQAERIEVLHLVELCLPLAGDARDRSGWLYARGHHVRPDGDIGRALADLAEAEAVARKLDLRAYEIPPLAGRGHELALIGDVAAIRANAQRALELVATPSPDACNDADLLSALSWALWLSRSLGGDAGDPEPILARAERYYHDAACVPGENPLRRAAARELQINAALAATDLADREVLRRRVAAIDRHALTPTQKEWVTYVDSELLLADGDFERALQSARSLRGSTDPLLAWKARILCARAEAARGSSATALAFYLEAEAVLDAASGRLAPDQGRAGLATTFQASAAHAIELQLAASDIEGAAATARRSRARRMRPTGSAAAISSLSPAAKARYAAAMERYRKNSALLELELSEAWRRPADERARADRRRATLQSELRTAIAERDSILLAAEQRAGLAPVDTHADLSLLYHPLPSGWVGFALTSERTVASRFDLPAGDDPGAASTALLAPFADAIAGATSIRVLAMGELLALPFHTLPWNGDSLLRSAPVMYGLDLARAASTTASPRRAVVIADPDVRVDGLGRLPSALAEGDAIAERLVTEGWSVRHLAGADATAMAVVAALREASWMHYAGHGIQAGAGGWNSALLLAGEGALDVGDVLALEHVPAAVVLSACESAGSHRARVGDMQIATAFLLAGADFVVAAMDELDDDAARQFSAALYRAPFSEPVDGPALVRRAMLEGAKAEAWPGFFVWVP